MKLARHLLLLALFAALAFRPGLANVAFACTPSGHYGHDNAAIASHADVGGVVGTQDAPFAEAHAAAPAGNHDCGHPAGCAGCDDAGSHCCASLFLIPASVSATRAPPGTREVLVEDTHAIASRPFDGPFRPPRTIPR